MSIRQRLRIPATLHVWGKLGRDPGSGDETDGFDPTKDRPLLVDLRQGVMTENREGGSVRLTDQWVMFLPPDLVEVDGKDEITVTGRGRWAFEGDPAPITVPRTGVRIHWRGVVRKVA